MNNWIRVVRTTALLVTLVAFSSKVHGAFSDAFDDLFTELAARADT